ncbi:hypothetical protein Tco_0638064 [Tanacetum coccineum]
MSGEEPTPQMAPVESSQMISTVKLPMLKKGEYTIWSMRMEQLANPKQILGLILPAIKQGRKIWDSELVMNGWLRLEARGASKGLESSLLAYKRHISLTEEGS